MKGYKVDIYNTFYLTHDVKCFRLEKPLEYSFEPGQATEVAINKPGWKSKKRPFTFTSLPEDEYLELTVKIYPDHRGVTNELHNTGIHDEMILHEVFGAIRYRGEGVFVAGGAGITPFLSILRMLERKNGIGHNLLLFGNKTRADIILEEELRGMLGNRFINILSEEKAEGYAHGLITKQVLREHIKDPGQLFYLCGPPPMVEKVSVDLSDLGVEEDMIVREDL